MQRDVMRLVEQAHVGASMEGHDCVRWIAKARLAKYDGDWTGEEIDAGLAGNPYEIIEVEGNLLMTVGATALWTKLTGGAGTVFDNTNAYIGVGDSTTAAAAGQTDLQAATNKFRKVQDATYPQVSTNTCVFRATFATGEANFVWNEWAIFNASSAGTMLNRKVESLGTKTTGSWQLTLTLSLA